MNDVLQGPWLFGATAGFGAKLSLVVMLLAAAMLTVGWRLAVRKDFEAHRWVQTIAACLNAVLVLAWMVRSFILYVLPEIPDKLGESTYALYTAHAIVGAIGLVLGLFVVLRGNELVPEGLKFTDYKPFMRASYALYMLATLMGVIVYGVLYWGG